jgi:hypothetical protein
MTIVEMGDKQELCAVAAEQRVLLLPHCLRPSETCPGKYSKQGLICPDDCSEPCAIRVLRDAAVSQGYKGVCVAPGGSMVLRFIEQTAPEAVVAVACQKELELGVVGVEELVREGRIERPLVCVVPLSKDGCVDTEVDVGQVVEWMRA